MNKEKFVGNNAGIHQEISWVVVSRKETNSS
jgi:hypothetical protein